MFRVVFNLIHKVLSDMEIGVLGNMLGFCPTLLSNNEAKEFCRFFKKNEM